MRKFVYIAARILLSLISINKDLSGTDWIQRMESSLKYANGPFTWWQTQKDIRRKHISFT